MTYSKPRWLNLNLFSGSIAELLHPPAGQIPFLDGLRSIAVLLVISGHLSAQFAAAHGSNLYSRLPFVADGWMGVDLFFVLSGFFIGGQLWKELRDSESIHVGRFILRRGFRIWPLYFFTFFCVLGFALTFGHGAAAKEYGWSDLIFVTNFHNRGLVNGSWSLCTEEQFYIFAPLALFFFARHLKAVQNCRPWLWGMLALIPLIRIAVWVSVAGHFFQHSPALFEPIYYASITHCDGLIMGMIVSNLWITKKKFLARFAAPELFVAASVVLLIGLHQLQKEIFDFTVLALLFGSLVWYGIERRPAVFNSIVFYWISRLSFGMYLNHEYMCPWMVNTVLPRIPFSVRFPAFTNLLGFVIVAFLSAVISVVTFCLVEHPFLRMRKFVLEGHPSELPRKTAPVR